LAKFRQQIQEAFACSHAKASAMLANYSYST
jgi:hypothetical protein